MGLLSKTRALLFQPLTLPAKVRSYHKIPTAPNFFAFHHRRQPLASHLARCFSSFPAHTPITMPALSPTMEDGAISSWIKKEGDEISAGDAICEIETDKATVDFELADDGFLAKILVEPSTRVKVGDIIGVLVEDSGSVEAFANATIEDFGKPKQAEVEPSINAPSPIVSSAPIVEVVPTAPQSQMVSGERIFISPFARKTAKENNIDIELLRGLGSGPLGRVKHQDVVNFMATAAKASPVNQAESSSSPAPNPPSVDFYDLPLQHKALADNLEMSKKEAPHYFLVSEIDLTQILRMREHFREKYEVDLAVNDFIVKAAATAMQSVPMANGSFRKEFIRIFNSVDINVFTKEGLGLIRSCEKKGLSAISEESTMILETASSRLDLGTFSIANFGMYGVSKAFPIVVHGQSACLGVGEIYQEYVPIEIVDSERLDFKQVEKVNISLSCDHRVVDGAVGAQWLQQFKKLMEDPSTLLL